MFVALYHPYLLNKKQVNSNKQKHAIHLFGFVSKHYGEIFRTPASTSCNPKPDTSAPAKLPPTRWCSVNHPLLTLWHRYFCYEGFLAFLLRTFHVDFNNISPIGIYVWYEFLFIEASHLHSLETNVFGRF